MNNAYHKNDIEKAHIYSMHHREQIEKSNYCGCFYCCRIFRPFQIHADDWVDDNDTALCPFCGIDSVIGDACGYPVTEEFLQAMKKFWF